MAHFFKKKTSATNTPNFFASTDIAKIVMKGSSAGALVAWVWLTTYVQEVVGSNPSTVYWMDIFSHGFVVKIVLFV